jgi:hypothetical protein
MIWSWITLSVNMKKNKSNIFWKMQKTSSISKDHGFHLADCDPQLKFQKLIDQKSLKFKFNQRNHKVRKLLNQKFLNIKLAFNQMNLIIEEYSSSEPKHTKKPLKNPKYFFSNFRLILFLPFLSSPKKPI